MTSKSTWKRFSQHFLRYDDLGFTFDVSRMCFPDNFFDSLAENAGAALEAMRRLESGAIANPDENRMVGHYWLRSPALAPNESLRQAIDGAREDVKAFAAAVHAGDLTAANGRPFTDVLVIGIGGSALGPQLVADALGGSQDPVALHFLDNTDPDGFDRILGTIGNRLSETLTLVISKSGGTKETRNGMLEALAVYDRRGIPFARQAVAITGEGSELDKRAEKENWLRRFPMWDWVGGRTSVMSTVGLVPAALQGVDIDAFLRGAAEMDEKTRSPDITANAGMLLALMWHYAGDGVGRRDMVILPYKDRLVLFSKYLQQLIMESLGKELDLDGNPVHQGIAVYGNKGSTDQHAYVQQLREGVNNFFVTFFEVRKSRAGKSPEMEPGIMSGDYLQGFLRGTRAALSENDRESMTISVPELTPFSLGALIALYERAVGFYASLVHINAYHQPGVEAGKKAAGRLLMLQGKVRAQLAAADDRPWTAEEIASILEADSEDVYHVLTHLAANDSKVRVEMGATPADDMFRLA